MASDDFSSFRCFDAVVLARSKKMDAIKPNPENNEVC